MDVVVIGAGDTFCCPAGATMHILGKEGEKWKVKSSTSGVELWRFVDLVRHFEVSHYTQYKKG